MRCAKGQGMQRPSDCCGGRDNDHIIADGDENRIHDKEGYVMKKEAKQTPEKSMVFNTPISNDHYTIFTFLIFNCIAGYETNRENTIFTGLAVLIMIAGLLIFPMGFGSTFFRHYCGDFASSYDTGHCLIGWSYMLGIMGTALSVFCPFLSQFTDMRARDIFT
ncbi:hypothetical protein C0Q70_08269 [Pomacea canaliculata]|uniref:Uncharacterized protein n=1 Tax=Pomacea canaliculata TaxID=400727 RepID=A0A2T7PHC9_POMCA|nr:hypothetical protein C0Q70_08269 [Pomacea canaliculata]